MRIRDSVYPEHFAVTHEFEFEPSSAELRLHVLVPGPDKIPEIKAYKYTKSTDEITATSMSQKACRDRYASAVHHVALRSIHEVFESDRRGLIRTISLEVGTDNRRPDRDPHLCSAPHLCSQPYVPRTSGCRTEGFKSYVRMPNKKATARVTFLFSDPTRIQPLRFIRGAAALAAENRRLITPAPRLSSAVQKLHLLVYATERTRTTKIR
jgi:hypothetical protein